MITRVLPEPGPAMTRTGPSGAVTASCCFSLRSPRSLLFRSVAVTASRVFPRGGVPGVPAVASALPG